MREFVIIQCGPGSSVGITTDYGLGGLGIESRCWRDFSHLSRPVLGPSVQWIQSPSPGVKSGRCVMLTSHPVLVPWPRKSRATNLLPLWAVRPVQSLSACKKMNFTSFLIYLMTASSTDIKFDTESFLHIDLCLIFRLNFDKLASLFFHTQGDLR